MARMAMDVLMKASAHLNDLHQAYEDAASNVESAMGREDGDLGTDDAHDAIEWLTRVKEEADSAIEVLSVELERVREVNRQAAFKKGKRRKSVRR